MQQEIIKTTAKFQEAAEPMKQRPCIVQVEEAAETRANQQQQLPNTVRASMDSQGRDNPFRPDGKIYKSADPIVDYYKHGPNQSRAQSPADALLSSGRADETKLDKDSNKIKKKNKKTENSTGDKKSCWRRWLCCGCRCCCRRKLQESVDNDNESIVISKQTKLVIVDQTNAVLEEPSHDHYHQKEQQPKKQQVSTTKTKPKTTAIAILGKRTQEEEENNQQAGKSKSKGVNSKCLIS